MGFSPFIGKTNQGLTSKRQGGERQARPEAILRRPGHVLEGPRLFQQMSSRPGRSSIWPLAVGEVGRQARARGAVDHVRRLSSRGIGMAGFNCMYSHGFLRVASCVPRGRVADPVFAARAHLELAAAGHARHVGVMLFPELGLSSYAIDDLLLQDALLDGAEAAVAEIVAASRDLYPVLVVGAPLRREGRLFNTAVVIHRGRVLGAVPKSYLPNYREFYERRHFAPGVGLCGGTLTVAGHEAPFGADLLFRSNGSVPFTFHVEICEDIWVPLPPSTRAAMAGAELLLNLSASNITIGKARHRRLLCASHSARCIAAYTYSAAGPGEFDDRPRMGRASGDLREWRQPWRERALSCWANLADRRYRPGTPASGAHADQYVRRLRPRRAGRGGAIPHRHLHARSAGGGGRAGAGDRALPLCASRCRAPARRMLRGLQHPGSRVGAAPRDNRHPTCRARRLRRARFRPRR